MEQINFWLRRIICFLIRFYQILVSPVFPPCCRFYPTCSEYAVNAVMHYGVAKGMWLTCGRLLRCQPWSKGGEDPVIPNIEKL